MKIYNPESFLVRFFFFVPVFWFLGLDLLIYHIAAFIIISNSRYTVNFRSEMNIIFALAFVLFCSASFSIFRGYEVSRVISSYYNISNLFIFLSFYIFSRYIIQTASKRIATIFIKSLAFFVFAMAVIAFCFYFAHHIGGLREFKFNTLISLIPINDFGLVNQHKSIEGFRVDWFMGSPQFRAYVLTPFATTSSFVANIMIGAYCLSVGMQKRVTKSNCILLLLLFLSGAFLMYVGLTRTQIFVFPIIWIVGFALSRFSMPVLLFVGLLILPLLAVPLYGFVEILLSGRAGVARYSSYAEAWRVVSEQSPLFGIGIKPREENFLVPIGSHSSIASFFTRGGLISLILGISLFIALPVFYAIKKVRWIKFQPKQNRIFLGVGISTIMSLFSFFPFGEVDAYSVVAAVLGIYFGLLSITPVGIQQPENYQLKDKVYA